MSELKFPKINSIILSGRLTRDLELKYIPNGTAVARISIAFDRSYQKNGEWQQETSYIDVTAWGQLAEKCANELHKGSPVIVEGYLKTHQYTDSNNQNRKSTDIVDSRISFLEKSENSQQNNESSINMQQDENTSGIDSDDVPF